MSGSTSVLPAAAAHPFVIGQAKAEASLDSKAAHHSTPTTSIPAAPLAPIHSTLALKEKGRAPAREDTRRAIRRRSLDLVAEANGDVDEFVREMDAKRKLLDEQIHKFIAQKEREFKRYEQEMRIKYRTSRVTQPSPESTVPTPLSHPSSGHVVSNSQTNATTNLDGGFENHASGNLRSRIDRRTANSGLEDVRPSYEREKDFMGLFTPSFLPLLDGKPELNRSPSAPALTETRCSEPLQPDRTVLHRANTEPLLDGQGNRRPGYGLRTPSSGSEGLVSVLKTSGARKNPKPMRVMLQLADDQPAVHPNDDLPTERGYAPVREAEAMHHSKQSEGSKNYTDHNIPSPSPSPPMTPHPVDIPPAHDSPIAVKRSSLTQGLVQQPSSSVASKAHATPFLGNSDDLDDVASPFPLDEEVDELQRPDSDWEVDFEENIGPDLDNDVSLSPVRSPDFDQSPLDVSPKIEALPMLSTPGLKICSSSSSSGQPISPGFSRPSVREDPIFESPAPVLADNIGVVSQGSLYDGFARQSFSARNNTMTGSLGESFMQRNAENMMRRRRS